MAIKKLRKSKKKVEISIKQEKSHHSQERWDFVLLSNVSAFADYLRRPRALMIAR